MIERLHENIEQVEIWTQIADLPGFAATTFSLATFTNEEVFTEWCLVHDCNISIANALEIS